MQVIEPKLFNSTAELSGNALTALQPTSAVRVNWHIDPRSIVLAYIAPMAADAQMSPEELLTSGDFGGVDEGGVEHSFNGEDMVAGIVQMGCWGFTDTNFRVIHLWAEKDCPRRRIAELVGHELGHVTAEPLKDDLAEEMRADQHAATAVMVLDILDARPSIV